MAPVCQSFSEIQWTPIQDTNFHTDPSPDCSLDSFITSFNWEDLHETPLLEIIRVVHSFVELIVFFIFGHFAIFI